MKFGSRALLTNTHPPRSTGMGQYVNAMLSLPRLHWFDTYYQESVYTLDIMYEDFYVQRNMSDASLIDYMNLSRISNFIYIRS